MSILFKSSHREYRRVIGSFSNKQTSLPVIFTNSGVLEQFVRYMYANARMSRSWQDASTFAMQLFIEYMDANIKFYDEPRPMFVAFVNALFMGTIEDGCDGSGLYWYPRQQDDSSKIIGRITKFTDWLAERNGPNVHLNPWKEANSYEQRLNWAAFQHKKDKCLLGHLFRDDPKTTQARMIRAKRLPISNAVAVKSFPESQIESLLSYGFRRRARDQLGGSDLRNVLVTYLMHYGGLRLSEALSLWTDDVTVENGQVIVRLYHPSDGLAPDKKSSRAQYLQERYGLTPRNRLLKAKDKQFLGWKDPLLTDARRKCFEVFFFPHSKGVIFAQLWREYHFKQRVKPEIKARHPYAFTNSSGQPYSHRMFRKAHKRAIERIGMQYGKEFGSTPHSHRHAYGKRLASVNAGPMILKGALHHQSIESSKVYTQPTTSEVRSSMADMEEKLAREQASIESFDEEV